MIFDKAKTFKINDDEMNELICKGIVTTADGLRLDATYPANLGDLGKRMKEEHQLLYDYKQKVREAIEQVSSHGEGCRCPVVMNKFARDKIFKELGL